MGDYFSEEDIDIQFLNLEFKNITFLTQGELMGFRHQTKAITKIQNGVFENLDSNGIRFDAADKLLFP